MIKNIIFDLGNVLIEWNCDRVYDKYFSSEQAKLEFYEKTQIKELNVRFDAGLPFAVGLTELASKFPEYTEAIWLWKHSWSEMLGQEISGSIEILQQLHAKKHPLFAITNWAAETFLYAEENFEFLKYFSDIVVSGREKLIKPDPAIYNLLLKRNNLLANESVFIDDSLKNVEAARYLGIIAIHFKTSLQLRSDLELLNIL